MLFIFIILSVLTIIGSLLPILNSDHWAVRGQMNLRQVYLVINIVCCFALVILGSFSLLECLLILLLVISIAICVKSIYPYSILATIEVPNVEISNSELQIKLFVFNVYQRNDQYNLLIKSVEKENPDIILLLETNKDWDDGIKSLYETYPYATKDIKDDTYGILLMSRIPLQNARINYLISKNIPSGEIVFELNGNPIRIIGMHPKPPIPGENLTSTKKDQEIIAAASYLSTLSKRESHILIGDLNEVAWSRTSVLFRKLTGMKDPRIGRGTYATFPAYSPIKFPLDHVYCSPNFSLVNYTILDNMGSDHHAVSIHFQLRPKKS